MQLEDLINKRVFIELKSGEEIDGILMFIDDIDDDENPYTTLNIRVDFNDYKIVYLTEIDKISEVG